MATQFQEQFFSSKLTKKNRWWQDHLWMRIFLLKNSASMSTWDCLFYKETGNQTLWTHWKVPSTLVSTDKIVNIAISLLHDPNCTPWIPQKTNEASNEMLSLFRVTGWFLCNCRHSQQVYLGLRWPLTHTFCLQILLCLLFPHWLLL